MRKVNVAWYLEEMNTEMMIKKHCKNCGKTTVFHDTNIRRHNANGKNIYRFAIYKCEQGHTWNNKLAIYKAYTDHVEALPTNEEEVNIHPATIHVTDYKQQNLQEIEITLTYVNGSYRLDKTLATYIQDWSQTSIVKKIRNGSIQMNGQSIKPNTKLHTNDCISILIS
jgi:hypothetical protein